MDGRVLPPFDPNAPADERRAQISARAALWDKAVRAWKDCQRDRSDRVRFDDTAQRLVRDHRVKQRVWSDQVHQIVKNKYASPAQLPWPACKWRRDQGKLTELSQFLAAHPATGHSAWCAAVERRAAELFLADGEFWDDVEAPGYRMLTALPGTPAALRGLPLNDRLWVRSINERIGFAEHVRFAAQRGNMHAAISSLYHCAWAQYLGQRNHPQGIINRDAYMKMVGVCLAVPIALQDFKAEYRHVTLD